ncbi:hypothetical protein BDF19DRAFT_454786 [Syncephalis fuscata]|nr:hypothetical protein BDF19DRAFT_454786 [Syncephalis fuscata]
MLFTKFTQAAIEAIRLTSDNGNSSSGVINSHRRGASLSKPLSNIKAFWKRHIQKSTASGADRLLRKTKSTSLFRNSAIFISNYASSSSTVNLALVPEKEHAPKSVDVALQAEKPAILAKNNAKKANDATVAHIAVNATPNHRNNQKRRRSLSMPVPYTEPKGTLLKAISETKELLEASTILHLSQYANIRQHCKSRRRSSSYSAQSLYPTSIDTIALQKRYTLMITSYN